MDTIRVLRIYEFEGPRADVEKQIGNSIHGEKRWASDNGVMSIRATTLGTYPEIIGNRQDTPPDEVLPTHFPYRQD